MHQEEIEFVPAHSQDQKAEDEVEFCDRLPETPKASLAPLMRAVSKGSSIAKPVLKASPSSGPPGHLEKQGYDDNSTLATKKDAAKSTRAHPWRQDQALSGARKRIGILMPTRAKAKAAVRPSSAADVATVESAESRERQTVSESVGHAEDGLAEESMDPQEEPREHDDDLWKLLL